MKRILRLLFFLIIIVLSVTCIPMSPSTIVTYPGEQKFGIAKGKKNEVNWEASPFLTKVYTDSTLYSLHVNSYTEGGFVKEALIFVYIPPVQGSYQINENYVIGEISSNYVTLQEDGHALEDFYIIDSNFDNVLKVLDFNLADQKLKGVVTAQFFIRDPEKKKNPFNPDKVMFEELEFEVMFE